MIFEELKDIFQRGLNQGQVMTPEQIFSSYLKRGLDTEDKKTFRDWFEETVNFSTLSTYLKNSSYREVIVHSPQLIQIETLNDTKNANLFEVPPIPDLQLSLEILCLQEKIDWNFSNPLQAFTPIFLASPLERPSFICLASPPPTQRFFLGGIQKYLSTFLTSM